MFRFLEERLRSYDKVLLVETAGLFEELDGIKMQDTGFGKFLVLTSECNLPESRCAVFCQISEDQFQGLIELYFTYEFSDKFLFVSGNRINYGNLHHMVDAGILKREEFFTALLGC